MTLPNNVEHAEKIAFADRRLQRPAAVLTAMPRARPCVGVSAIPRTPVRITGAQHFEDDLLSAPARSTE